MRSIPAELKAKIESARQTLGENADPRLKIFVNNSRWVELFKVYTIHELSDLGAVDVTARRGAAGEEPSRVYAVYIEGGTAHVKSKPLPYNETIPWEYEFEVGAADDIAIEFNGYWDRSRAARRFDFVTAGDPWIFVQHGGVLTAQQGQGVPFELATGAGRVCAIRGWLPAQADYTQDQGLIVAYLKSGSLYYRNYCLQADGVTYLWEPERQVAELSHGDYTDLALFRANDFRVGFVAQRSDSEIYWAVTERNWAGMSLYPETGTMGVTGVSVEFKPLEFVATQTRETGTASISHIFPALCPVDYEITYSGRITGPRKAEVAFNYPVLYAGQASEWTIAGARAVQSLSLVGNKVKLTLTEGSDPLPTVAEISGGFAWLNSVMPLVIKVTDSCRVPYYTLDFSLVGEPPHVYETGTLSIAEIGINYIDIDRKTGATPTETGLAEFVDLGVVLLNLSGHPV